jgi:hypothetical protein
MIVIPHKLDNSSIFVNFSLHHLLSDTSDIILSTFDPSRFHNLLSFINCLFFPLFSNFPKFIR